MRHFAFPPVKQDHITPSAERRLPGSATDNSCCSPQVLDQFWTTLKRKEQTTVSVLKAAVRPLCSTMTVEHWDRETSSISCSGEATQRSQLTLLWSDCSSAPFGPNLSDFLLNNQFEIKLWSLRLKTVLLHRGVKRSGFRGW